jgi:hypothetical protein
MSAAREQLGPLRRLAASQDLRRTLNMGHSDDLVMSRASPMPSLIAQLSHQARELGIA